jgi:hypothetical protein
MRKLQFGDLFTLTRIIKKMNIKAEIKELITDISNKTPKEKEEAQQNLQVELTMLFVEHLGDAQQEIYKLFADISSQSISEVENMELKDVMEIVNSIFNDDQFSGFFGQALNSAK